MEIKLNNDPRSHGSESQDWLMPYSDMVTLLLAFFVLFFAISQVDQVKFEMIMEYFSKSEVMPLHELEKKFREMVKTHQLEESVDVALTPDGLMVNFQDNILFDSGHAELKERSLPILDELAKILNSPDVVSRTIQVQGHTDSVPLAKNALYPSNWELSTARSSSVIRHLLTALVDARRFLAVGFADTHMKEEESEGHRGLPVNRRVSLLIK